MAETPAEVPTVAAGEVAILGYVDGAKLEIVPVLLVNGLLVPFRRWFRFGHGQLDV
jgi:hypothetical protein